jgi:hypothetical protein
MQTPDPAPADPGHEPTPPVKEPDDGNTEHENDEHEDGEAA